MADQSLQNLQENADYKKGALDEADKKIEGLKGELESLFEMPRWHESKSVKQVKLEDAQTLYRSVHKKLSDHLGLASKFDAKLAEVTMRRDEISAERDRFYTETHVGALQSYAEADKAAAEAGGDYSRKFTTKPEPFHPENGALQAAQSSLSLSAVSSLEPSKTRAIEMVRAGNSLIKAVEKLVQAEKKTSSFYAKLLAAEASVKEATEEIQVLENSIPVIKAELEVSDAAVAQAANEVAEAQRLSDKAGAFIEADRLRKKIEAVNHLMECYQTFKLVLQSKAQHSRTSEDSQSNRSVVCENTIPNSVEPSPKRLRPETRANFSVSRESRHDLLIPHLLNMQLLPIAQAPYFKAEMLRDHKRLIVTQGWGSMDCYHLFKSTSRQRVRKAAKKLWETALGEALPRSRTSCGASGWKLMEASEWFALSDNGALPIEPSFMVVNESDSATLVDAIFAGCPLPDSLTEAVQSTQSVSSFAIDDQIYDDQIYVTNGRVTSPFKFQEGAQFYCQLAGSCHFTFYPKECKYMINDDKMKDSLINVLCQTVTLSKGQVLIVLDSPWHSHSSVPDDSGLSLTISRAVRPELSAKVEFKLAAKVTVDQHCKYFLGVNKHQGFDVKRLDTSNLRKPSSFKGNDDAWALYCSVIAGAHGEQAFHSFLAKVESLEIKPELT